LFLVAARNTVQGKKVTVPTNPVSFGASILQGRKIPDSLHAGEKTAPIAVIPNLATGYTSRHIEIKPDFLDGVVRDKNIYSTVEDMFVRAQALYTETLLKKETLEEAFTPGGMKPGQKEDYVFGFRMY
jgi:hypothetical protein